MQHRGSHFFHYFVLSCLALCLGLAAFATGGHNFAGSYRIMQATQQGAMVQVRLSLRVINYSGRDVSNATISLKSSLPHSADDPRHAEAGLQMQQPTFQGVTLHFNEHQVVPPLEATFTIPVREYAQWMKGARPNFVIEFQNAAGKTVRQPVELTNRP